MKKITALFLAVIFSGVCMFSLAGCKKNDAHTPVVDPIDDNYRVFYQIFVGSFSDSDGDGCGDLRGIINRMDYLNDGDISSGKSLGVQGIWLSPIFKSPSYHKYDTTDYYTIDPKFGTEDDLVELIELCHSRNVKIILDLALNHTSTDNLWFQKFLNAHKSGDTADKYYDYYVHCTRDECKGGRTYRPLDGCPGEYYECNFSSSMPELNYDNDDVRSAALDIAKNYLELGVDGFRFDAVKYIYFTETQSNVDFWSSYMDELRSIKPDIYCIGECWSGESETLEYIKAMNCFNFQAAQAEGFVANAVKGENIDIFANYIESYTQKVREQNPDGMMIPFLSNHDMDRSSGYLTLATRRTYMAANLYILCSGSPVIYYGEEIAMKGSRGGSNTDANRRLAMLWGDDDTVHDPTGATYERSKQTNGTVASHTEDEDSLLNYYGRLISLRNKYPAIARGEYKAVSFGNRRFGGFLITYGGEKLVLLHNTLDDEQTINLSSCRDEIGFDLSELCDFIGQGDATLDGTMLTVGPMTSVIMK